MHYVRRIASFICILVSAAGCATAPLRTAEAPVFFPPAPEPARIQFLASYAGAQDIEPAKSGFEKFVTGEKDSQRKLDKPYGVAIHDGKLYVCDTNLNVMVFDLKNKTFEPLQGAQGLGKLIQPINISIDAAGVKYVTDPVRQQVVAFDKNDFYLKAYGSPGNWRPVDAVPYEDRLFVADAKNGAVRVFDLQSGENVATIGNTGDPQDHLDLPTNLAFDRDGSLYVSDAGRFQVVKMDRDGHVLRTFGRPGSNLGHFARPKGVAVDRSGKVFVVDAAFYNVQIFNQQGFTLLFFGEGGTAPGKLILPAKVIVDYDNLRYFQDRIDPRFEAEALVIVTSQFGERLVNVFAYGKEKGRTYATEEELLEQVRKLQTTFEQKASGDKPDGAAQGK